MYKYIHLIPILHYYHLFKVLARVDKKLGIVDILGVDKLGIDDMAPNLSYVDF